MASLTTSFLGTSARNVSSRKTVTKSWSLYQSQKSIISETHKKFALSATAESVVTEDEEDDIPIIVPSFGPDMFVLELAESLQEQDKSPFLGTSKDLLDQLGEEAARVALNLKWPTDRDEQFRFSNIKWLRAAELVPSSPVSPANLEDDVANGRDFDISNLSLEGANGSTFVFVDGVLSRKLSSLGQIPKEVFVGTIGEAPEEILNNVVKPNLGKSAEILKDELFPALNSIGALDLGVIFIPQEFELKNPIHIIYLSSGSGKSSISRVSSPRILVVLEKESKAEIVEEFVGTGEGYWTNSVTEIILREKASLSHAYVQAQNREAFHTKKTFISQEESSNYSVTETSFGSKLSRHNLQMVQRGPETETEVSTITVSGNSQLQDLHSSLVLDFPRGKTSQLHKCIVTHAKGFAVFDGNVKVNRMAQQTDAGQLSRSLLLSPKGTVSVKPNLQIIADDVKCSHGAAISDLEEDQLFYFRARGVSPEAARSALLLSFAGQVTQKLEPKDLRLRVEKSVRESLLDGGAI